MCHFTWDFAVFSSQHEDQTCQCNYEKSEMEKSSNILYSLDHCKEERYANINIDKWHHTYHNMVKTMICFFFFFGHIIHTYSEE